MSYKAVVITVSDKCTTGERQDTSGPAICEMLGEAGYTVIHTVTVPDEVEQIRDAMLHACDTLHADLVISTGGTGLSPRDVTPEATRLVVEREIPAIPQAMLYSSLAITPRAMLSRAALSSICPARKRRQGKTSVRSLPRWSTPCGCWQAADMRCGKYHNRDIRLTQSISANYSL